MKILRTLLIASTISLGFLPLALADDGFVIHSIQVQGLERIREGTVISYLPVHIGQTFTAQDSANVLSTLYKTGFFSNVQLFEHGNTLVIQVAEQPVIGLININGNKQITTKQLNVALKKLGVVEGEPYNPGKLKAITQALQQEYGLLGHHDATVTADVTNEPHNRVGIVINVHEGGIAKIEKMTIIGNHAFSQRRLFKNFQLTTHGLGIMTFLNHNDRYSEDKLDQDLQSLQNFYYNYGFLKFKVISHEAVIAPDNRVTITIVIDEGPVYHISGTQLEGVPIFAHDPIVEKDVGDIRPGEVFSRSKMIAVTHNIGVYFANRGYAFPQINVNPVLNDADRTVFLDFTVNPGEQVYVRHVNYSGNAQTEDFVLRNQMRQMEGSLFSLKNIEESKRRIANLPYMQNVQVSPTPVPGSPDLVDLDYTMQEINAGKASLEGGYSDQYGFLVGVNVSDPNFLGSGRYVSVGYTRSQLYQQYSISYANPFFTTTGITQSLSAYYNTTTANSSLNQSAYSYDDVGGTMSYGIPITEYDSYSLGVGYDNIDVFGVQQITPATTVNGQAVPAQAAAPSVLQFLQQPNGSNFYELKLLTGIGHSTLDQAMFPNRGNTQGLNFTLGTPVDTKAIGYFQLTYAGQWYFPLGHGFILEPHTTWGYGDTVGNTKIYPFFNNFYAGGIDTLPGFAPNSLGPLNPNYGNNAIGGNVEILGGIHFIFPNPYSNRLRTAILLDAGNIFDTNKVQYTPAQLATTPGLIPISYENIALKNMRVATGLVVEWYSPLGPIDFSLATPIVKKSGDQTEIFGFTFGMAI